MSYLPSRFYRPTLNLTEADSAEIIAAYTYKPANTTQTDDVSTEDFDDPNDYLFLKVMMITSKIMILGLSIN